MKQLKLLLVLLALGFIFLFAVQEVQSTEVSAQTNSLTSENSRRLESEEGKNSFV